MLTTAPHIVVLGAGYAGLGAAKLAAKRTGATVTLVNERDRFVERVRNHQLATGQRLRDLPLRDLVAGTGIRLVVDRVTRIDQRGDVVEGAEGIGVAKGGRGQRLEHRPGGVGGVVGLAGAVRLTGEGELVIPPLTAEDVPAEAEAFTAELTEVLLLAPIASLLVELDRRTGFLDCFTHAGGKQPRSP
jgi:NADPH-dependent 2,4-dienoyl-CoA reductase/sulfur reductase-like enzyme